MSGKATIRGLDKVQKNLKKAIGTLDLKAVQGLRLAALIIKGDSMRRTPVDTSALKNSAFTFSGKDDMNRPFAVIGYTQDYSIFVHENLESNHITGEAKFLEKAVIAKKKEALAILARTMRIR